MAINKEAEETYDDDDDHHHHQNKQQVTRHYRLVPSTRVLVSPTFP
jgi:hypothetical protein